ncbi:MAG: hypothetical protein EB018_09720 [Gammaproteobacteria bacterium]|nr:hypothetical protein [Gammaproteobacteria bacterium]
MTTRWRIVDLANFSGTITTKRGRLTINNTDIPLADVTCIITGPATTWDAGLPALATSYDIPIIICDWRNVPIATLTGWGDNTRIGARHTAQANLSLPRKKNAWMHIVRAKILGQAANLPSNTPQHLRLQQLARSTRSGDPNNTEATAAAIDSEGWLHTGDVGTMDTRGYLRITDRKKDMFITGGFNCYPAEIESLISAHPAVAQVAVVGIADERLGEVAAAYVVLRPATRLEPSDFIAWCRDNMANYKVPRRVHFVDQLPTTASGKVQRYALRDANDGTHKA